MKNILELDNELHFSIDGEIYTEDVIYKCFYWYGDNYTVDIRKENKSYLIFMSCKPNMVINHKTLLERIKQDLIDFKLRDIVTKETKNIRELLTAKAFAYFQPDDNPITEISDPVGFNPNEF